MLDVAPLGAETGTPDEMLFCRGLNYKLERLSVAVSEVVRRGAFTVEGVLKSISM